MEAMANDGAPLGNAVHIDGGMAANDWFCQFLADILQTSVERPRNLETTALGAAFLAGMATGVWDGLDALAQTWKARDTFPTRMGHEQRDHLIRGWRSAVAKTLS
jgi:glycerol kinase